MQQEKGGLGNRLPRVTCMQSVATGQVLLQTSHTLLTITACVFHVTDQSVSFHTCVLPKGGPCSTTRNSADTDTIAL